MNLPRVTKRQSNDVRWILRLLTVVWVTSGMIFASSCTTKPTDLRTLVSAETLVYLETNDLAGALQPILDNKAFAEVAKSKPDFSALRGVQMAVAVTGFETTEEKLTDENSVGRIRPRFVAVADTHAWNYQAVAFAEQKLGDFVASIYKSDADEEITDKHGGKYFTWTAKDGRKAFALVTGSLIYFGNDESAIEKCLAVRRGETDSILKTGKVPQAAPETLASGYVSTDGIAQIASIIGLKFAADASEDADVQSAIAGILPQLLRNSMTEISWTATKTEEGIEDKYVIGMPSDVASIFDETFMIGDDSEPITTQNNTIIGQIPSKVQSATRYNLKNPQIAWRSVLMAGQKTLGGVEGKIVTGFAGLLFEPYGISNPELFLNSLGGVSGKSRNIVTAKLDPQSDQSFVIAARGNDEATRKALSSDFKPPNPIVEGSINIWSIDDDDLHIAFDQDMIKIGSKEELQKFNGMRLGDMSDIRSDLLRRLAMSKSPIATVGRDSTTTLILLAVLAREGHGDTDAESTYLTETRFTRIGIERRTISDFGLIGSIIAQLGGE